MLKSILIALALLPTYKEDAPGPEKTAQLTAVAASVAAATKDPDVLAFVLALGHHESGYSLRIHRGACHRWECDRGRARGPWQPHKNSMSAENWDRMVGVENTAVQAAHAVKIARWALKECRATGDQRILGAFRLLGARGCNGTLKGEGDRLATYRRIRGAL